MKMLYFLIRILALEFGMLFQQIITEQYQELKQRAMIKKGKLYFRIKIYSFLFKLYILTVTLTGTIAQ
ncbi:hypothetical protein SAMN05216378_2032 [Paenibacillus catalpae]|uniref:Uncharacterized protein n=1 Tax=Paenibacillus catalpae TaxID=1045775 RepID=A0A1I1X6G2_9BACL|nr:hypothetical protein SAMN05216378_2032 [Paenibacillus catalpae]